MACRLLLFLLILILNAGTTYAQNYLTEKTVSGKTRKLFEEARMHLNASRGPEAQATLEKVLDREPGFIDARLMYADLLLQKGNYAQAEAEFEKAVALGPDYAPLAYFFLAEAEFEQKKYEETIAHLDQYLQSGKAGGEREQQAERLKASARLAADAREHPVPFEPKSLGPGVNTDLQEYLPSLTADEKTLIFVRVVGRQEDFYISHKVDGEWQTAEPMTQINHPQFSEGAQSLSANGKVIVFTVCEREGVIGRCDLYLSEYRNGRWQPARNLGAPVNTRQWESQPSLSADGKTLYFVSDRKGGHGLIDIWESRRQADGSWGEPENLGPAINTPGKDQAPFIHPDGRTLYFMSDGHPGLGGFDIYLSHRQEDGTWGAPQNLGYPINTEANEGAFVVGLSGHTAYFATDREGLVDEDVPEGHELLRRSSDIYSFELYPEARPHPVTYVKAVVKDVVTGLPLVAEVDFVRLANGQTFVTDQTDEEGEFLVVLPIGEDYALNVSRPGYLFHSEHFALSETGDLTEPFLLEIELAPIPKPEAAEPVASKPIVLKNVFFETGSAELRAESTTELKRLADLLRENPNLKIQINGHTDNVGSDEDNRLLSENRAKAVYDYLIGQGIEAARLRYEGYGETQPVASNDTPEGRRQNRRTEFVIWEK